MLDEFPLATHGWDIFVSKRPLVGLDSNIEPTGGRSSWLPPEPGRVPGGSRNDTDFQAENAYDMAVSARRRRDCIEDPLSFGGDRCAPGTPCLADNGRTHGWAGFLTDRPLVGLNSRLEPTGGPNVGVGLGRRGWESALGKSCISIPQVPMKGRFRRVCDLTAARTDCRSVAAAVRPAHLASSADR